MKRIYAFLCVCLLLLTGCTPTAPTQEERAALSQMSTVIDGAFFCTPQELVDIINDAAANDESGLALQLSNYTAPGASIYLANGSSSVILTLEISIHPPRVGWDGAARQSAINAVKSKSHMVPAAERSGGTEVVVPEETKKLYRQLNPGVTDEEIKRHYAKSHK